MIYVKRGFRIKPKPRQIDIPLLTVVIVSFVTIAILAAHVALLFAKSFGVLS